MGVCKVQNYQKIFNSTCSPYFKKLYSKWGLAANFFNKQIFISRFAGKLKIFLLIFEVRKMQNYKKIIKVLTVSILKNMNEIGVATHYFNIQIFNKRYTRKVKIFLLIWEYRRCKVIKKNIRQYL